MPHPDIFARCDVSSTTAGALPREIIDFLLSPGGHSLLIKGDAGTGKTTMALQIIEALSDRQPEYYLSSRVSDVALYHQFPWLKERVEKNQLMRAGMAFLRRSWNRDGSKRINRLEGQIEAGELGLEDDDGPLVNPDGSVTVEVGSMLPELEMAYDIAETNLPKKTLVVLDSVEALAENYGIPAYRIMSALQKDLVEKAGTNIVFVMETAERSHLDYLGDGIVVLRNTVHGNNRVRTIDIEKLRGSSIRNWRYLFTLEGGRVTVVDRDLDLNGMAVNFNQKQRRGVHRQSHPAEILHGPDGEIIHEFEGHRHDAMGDDRRHRFRSSIDIVEYGHHRLFGGRHGDQFESDLVEDAERALRTYQEAAQVVAGHTLDRAGAGFDHIPADVEKFQAHHIIPGHSVAQAAQASGVFRDITAEGRNRLAAGIGRIEEPFGLDRRREPGGHHPGFDHRIEVCFIDFEDSVERVGQHHHPPCFGDGPAAEVGTGPAYGQRQSMLVAYPDHLAQGLA
ncbi:MAG: circadian clock protein KaiC [Methanomassiliicoccales archaeon PtaB.Bin215]|nr:MAG: circadian clock protein KaiC [Methanomassiliicoccales archaeon PtaB.Bin215]